jgi:hypothetical protein
MRRRKRRERRRRDLGQEAMLPKVRARRATPTGLTG